MTLEISQPLGYLSVNLTQHIAWADCVGMSGWILIIKYLLNDRIKGMRLNENRKILCKKYNQVKFPIFPKFLKDRKEVGMWQELWWLLSTGLTCYIEDGFPSLALGVTVANELRSFHLFSLSKSCSLFLLHWPPLPAHTKDICSHMVVTVRIKITLQQAVFLATFNCCDYLKLHRYIIPNFCSGICIQKAGLGA